MWDDFQDVVVYTPNTGPTSIHIASFDLNNTLIQSDRGLLTPQGDDWIWYSDLTLKYLDTLKEEGWTIVVFTTQTEELTVIQERIEEMLAPLKYDFYVLIARNEENLIDAWNLFLDLVNLTPSFASFHCGHNFDSVNQEFARQIGLEYYLPVEILPDHPDPKFNYSQEIIIATGIDTQYKLNYIENLQNNMDYHTPDIYSVDKLIQSRRPVIIPGENPTLGDRLPYVHIGNRYGVPIRIFWFTRIDPSIQADDFAEIFERPTLYRDGTPVIKL